MNTTTLVIGGCRSGKSSHAIKLAESHHGRRNMFIATCVPQDAEMSDRVKRHRQERGRHWQTVETPLDPAAALCESGPVSDVAIIDCLTLWISNLMLDGLNDDQILHRVGKLCDSLLEPPCPVILVSNEVGAGVVPENHLARRFRDLTGWCNQRVAASCKEVIWMVAGIAVPVKPQPSVG
jgi:adenosylcobinamide kinase/adenosylcobinamide-phosphate guanylyltransferase